MHSAHAQYTKLMLTPSTLFFFSKLNNGDNSSTDGFLMEDNSDCKSDCLFATDTPPSDNENVIYGNKTDVADTAAIANTDTVKDLNLAAVTNGFESICLKSPTTTTTTTTNNTIQQQNGDDIDEVDGGGDGDGHGECSTTIRSDINHNGDVNINSKEDLDSDTECTEPSENTTVKSAPDANYERSVETSTETLVSDHLLCG